MDRFAEAVGHFGAAHAEDPKDAALRYHRRLAYWIDVLEPGASEPLRLAAHCQHIRRWLVPRDRFPTGRAGYREWRSTLARFHADEAERILRDVGYDDDAVLRVRALLLKKTDPDAQALEDAVCLTFLETDLADFAPKHPREKIIDILQKTWKKMSPRGRAAALELAEELPEDLRALVHDAQRR